MEQNQHTYRNVGVQQRGECSQPGEQALPSLLFSMCRALITTMFTGEPQQGRRAGERPGPTEGTPNPVRAPGYGSISHSCQTAGGGSAPASNLLKKRPIPLLLYLQTRVSAARLGTRLRWFGAQLSPTPWVSLDLGVWPLFVNGRRVSCRLWI